MAIPLLPQKKTQAHRVCNESMQVVSAAPVGHMNLSHRLELLSVKPDPCPTPKCYREEHAINYDCGHFEYLAEMFRINPH